MVSITSEESESDELLFAGAAWGAGLLGKAEKSLFGFKLGAGAT